MLPSPPRLYARPPPPQHQPLPLPQPRQQEARFSASRDARGCQARNALKPRGRAAGTDRQRRRRLGHIRGRIPCRCPGILCDQPGCGPGEARRAPPPPAILGDSARIGRTPALGPRQRDRGDGLLTDKSPSTMATPPPPPRTLEFPARLPSPACALGTLMCRCCINAGRSCAYPSSCFTPLLYACWAQILQSFTGIAARWRPAGRRFRQLRKVLKKKVAQVS